MSKRTKKTNQQLAPLAIALICIILGLIGLGLVNRQKTATPSSNDNNSLQVTNGQSQATQQSQNSTGSQLQQAGKANALIQGKDGSALQQGASGNSLLK